MVLLFSAMVEWAMKASRECYFIVHPASRQPLPTGRQRNAVRAALSPWSQLSVTRSNVPGLLRRRSGSGCGARWATGPRCRGEQVALGELGRRIPFENVGGLLVLHQRLHLVREVGPVDGLHRDGDARVGFVKGRRDGVPVLGRAVGRPGAVVRAEEDQRGRGVRTLGRSAAR